MTAVIYARYSSDNQREESIEGQIRECTAYAEKNGITIVKHYIDRAISAKTDNRPEFQQMIKDSDKKLFDIVLVWKLDRFARNRYDSARYKTQLKKNGVKLMSATEIISEGPEGIILESVLEGYAEYYSADLSEKVIRGMTENALKGKFSGGAIPFGYVINADRRFEIDPLTAPFVAETFQRYNDGQTMREIRDWLNEKGIKNKRGGPMSFNVIQHMLNNRRYIGELKYRDILIPDAIPPIVSVELFNDVQEKMLKNKKAPARRKAEDDYLLTTKLFCGYCGALMFGESGTSRTGEVHRYYKCATAKKHKGCKKKTVRKQWLEDLVVNQTMQLVKDDAAMESIIAKVMELQNKENTNIPLYEKQLRDAESGIQNMLNAIQAGILTSSTKERLEQLEETKRELEARIAEEKLAKPKVTEEFIRFWLLRFRKLDMRLKDQRQALVDTFINAIYLYDDKVLITFNYKEGTQTVTFGEAVEVASEGNGSDLDCFPAPVLGSFKLKLSFLFYFSKQKSTLPRRAAGWIFAGSYFLSQRAILQPFALQHELLALGTGGDELDLMVQLLLQELHIGLCLFGQLVPASAAGDVLIPAGQKGDHRFHAVKVGQRIEAGDFNAVQRIAGDDRDLLHAAEDVQLGQGDLVGTLAGQTVPAGHAVKGADAARPAGGGTVFAACLAQLLIPVLAHGVLGRKGTGTHAGGIGFQHTHHMVQPAVGVPAPRGA